MDVEDSSSESTDPEGNDLEGGDLASDIDNADPYIGHVHSQRIVT